MAGGVEYQVTKVDPTSPQTKGMVHQVHKVSEEIAATIGGKVYRARIINDPTAPTVAGKVYQIVLIDDPDDPSVKGMVYNAILTGGSEAVVVGPAVSPLSLPDAIADTLSYVKAFGGTEQRKLPAGYTQVDYIYFLANSYLTTDINPTYDGRYEFDFQTTTLGSSGATSYLGVRPSSSGNGGLRVARISSQVFRIYGFGSYKDSTTTAAANTRYKFVWDNQHAVMTSGGTTVLDLTFTDTGACAYPITINGWNSAGTVTPGSEGIFVYSFKAWNAQGELVADYVPTKDPDGIVGFYDTVSESFKTATAGTIAAGPDATPTPTPNAPMDIVSNNGVLTFTPNLLDMASENIVLGKYINNSGVITDSGPNFYNSKYIPVSAGQTYTWSTSSSIGYFSVMEYDSNYVFKKRTLFSNAGTSGSITLRSDTAFVLIGSNMDGTDVTIDKVVAVDWQFEKGSSATAYKPYSPTGIYADGTMETIEDTIGNTATTETLLAIASDRDVQEIISGNITRKIGVKVLDGSENWVGTTVAGITYYMADLLDNNDFSHLICTHFVNDAPMLSDNSVYKSAGSSYLQIRYDTAGSLENMKSWLATQYAAGTPVIVIYPLETATTESVTGQTLQVQAGDNTLEITQASLAGLELEAEYEKEGA